LDPGTTGGGGTNKFGNVDGNIAGDNPGLSRWGTF